MNAFEKLLRLPAGEQRAKGIEHTPREIAQQPGTWAKAAASLRHRQGEIASFMTDAGLLGKGDATLIFTGAGSSEFVGNAIAPAVQSRLQRQTLSLPTTHFVTHAPSMFLPKRRYVLVSFARSGNSPESAATYELARQHCPGIRQIAVTCNKDGALAQTARTDGSALCIELPEETNDRSLVMTSSFTTMALTGLGLSCIGTPETLAEAARSLGEAGDRVVKEHGDALERFASRPFTRACFLGSGALFGAMQEAHLKMQEMTEGRVAAMFNSFVGLRHGPQVFVNDDCIVVAALSSDAWVRRYEMDMLRELKSKKQGCGTLVVCDRATPEIRGVASGIVELWPEGGGAGDDFRMTTDVMVCQILATFRCLHAGLKPDNPSVGGTIHRVVQGVTIYEK